MVWKIRGDCTYTTAANKTARQNAVQSLIDTYNVTEAGGRFPAGLVSQSTTRFTLSVNADTYADADAFIDQLRVTLTSVARSTTFFCIFEDRSS